jgi:hypothetical protein
MCDKIITESQEADDEMKLLMNAGVIKSRKEQRDKLLIESDKYVLVDYPISLENKMLILNYSEDLRNFNYSDFYLTFPNFPF